MTPQKLAVRLSVVGAVLTVPLGALATFFMVVAVNFNQSRWSFPDKPSDAALLLAAILMMVLPLVHLGLVMSERRGTTFTVVTQAALMVLAVTVHPIAIAGLIGVGFMLAGAWANPPGPQVPTDPKARKEGWFELPRGIVDEYPPSIDPKDL